MPVLHIGLTSLCFVPIVEVFAITGLNYTFISSFSLLGVTAGYFTNTNQDKLPKTGCIAATVYPSNWGIWM